MVEMPSPLENFKINSWYKYLLYVFGIILILSFFVEPVNVNISALRQFSLNTITLGIWFWVLEGIFTGIGNYYDDEARAKSWSRSRVNDTIISISIFGYFIIGFSIFIWWMSVWGLKLFP